MNVSVQSISTLLLITASVALLQWPTNGYAQTADSSQGTTQTSGAEKLKGTELSLNGFRNPSIGLEARYNHVSAHLGYYTTILSSEGKAQDHSNNFVKAGLTAWYLPFGKAATPSALYSSVSWLFGLDQDYRNRHALMVETGLRVHIWQGLNARLGVAALIAADKSTQINHTPGISYSFRIK